MTWLFQADMQFVLVKMEAAYLCMCVTTLRRRLFQLS